MREITSYHSYQIQRGINNPFVIVIGPSGSGKKLQSRKVAEDKGRQFVAIEGKKENIELITSLVDLSVPTTICIYDYTEMSTYAINALLKVAEETPENLELVLCSRTNKILPTIMSRGQVVFMDMLNSEDLEQAVEEIFEIDNKNLTIDAGKMINTVGDAIHLKEMMGAKGLTLESVKELFEKIDKNIEKITLSNALKMVDSLIDDKKEINLIPYLSRYLISKYIDEEMTTYSWQRFQFYLQGLNVKDSYQAYYWIINGKQLKSI